MLANEGGKAGDHFQLFGLSRRFGVDRSALERKFYELSRGLHPDRFAQADAPVRAAALQKMSELNVAYQTLKSPDELRQYYLRLEGFEAPAEAAKAVGSMALAESWFELQDTLMENPDQAPAQIQAFEAQLQELKRNGAQSLSALESEIDQAAEAQGAAPRPLLEKLSKEIQSQNYFKSMERDVERIKKRFSA